MTKKLISQIDKRWHLVSRQDKHSADALAGLDFDIINVLDNPSTRNKQYAIAALAKFTQSVEKLIDRGKVLNGKRTYTIYNYGCWDCCLCMVATDFKQRLFEYGKSRGLTPTPQNFLRVLRTSQILSVIGFQFEIALDVMSIITRSRVQLVMQEDYGRRGVRASNSPLLKFALRHRKDLTIVACVKDHAVFGNKPGTHWVILDPVGSDISDGLMMRDPAKTSIKPFRYRRLYMLCLYSTRKQAQALLANRA